MNLFKLSFNLHVPFESKGGGCSWVMLDDSDQGKVATVAPISTNSAESQEFIMGKVLGPCKSESQPPFSAQRGHQGSE